MKKLSTLLFILSICMNTVCGQNLSPAQVVQTQFDAYNQKNLEAFLAVYADTIKIFKFPNQLLYSDKQEMRKLYTESFKNPFLHATLTSRSILGNTVIDQEYIMFDKEKPATELFVIYKIKQDKIVEMYWLRKEVSE